MGGEDGRSVGVGSFFSIYRVSNSYDDMLDLS